MHARAAGNAAKLGNMILATTCLTAASDKLPGRAKTQRQGRWGKDLWQSQLLAHVISVACTTHSIMTRSSPRGVKLYLQDRSEEAKKASQEASRLRERLGKAGVPANKSTPPSKSTPGSSAQQNGAKETASAVPAPRAPEAEAKAAESFKGGASNGAPPTIQKSNSVSHAKHMRSHIASPRCVCCVCCTCCLCSSLLLHAPRACLPCAAGTRHPETQETPGSSCPYTAHTALVRCSACLAIRKRQIKAERGHCSCRLLCPLPPLVSLLGEWVSFERQLEGVDGRLRGN